MDSHENGLGFYLNQQTSERSPAGDVYRQRTTIAAGVGTPAILGFVTGLAIVVLAAVLLVVLLRPAPPVPRGDDETDDPEVRDGQAAPEGTAEAGAAGRPHADDPVAGPIAAERELPVPDLILLNPQPLRAGDEAEIHVSSAPLCRVEFQDAAGAWCRVEGNTLRLPASGTMFRVEARACDDAGGRSPLVVWSWPVLPPNRPPVLSVAHQPETPRAGGLFPVSLAASDPDGDPCTTQYRVGDNGPWVDALGGQALLGDLPAGPLVVSFRALDGFDLASGVVTRRWEILPRRNRSPVLSLPSSMPRELWVGDYLHIDAYPSDPDGDTAWVEISEDGESWRELFASQLSLGPLEAGVVTVHLRAVDKSDAASAVVVHSVRVKRQVVQVAVLGEPGRSSVVSSSWRDQPVRETLRYRPSPQEQLFKYARSGGFRTQRLNREEASLRGAYSRFR
jgi:hypothetical protein